VPGFQSSGQLYKIANQPVNSAGTSFFMHATLDEHPLSLSNFSHLKHCSTLQTPSFPPHTISNHMPVTPNNVTCQCHEMAAQAFLTILSGSYVILLWPCMCVGGRMCGGYACLPHVLPHTHTLSVSSLTGHACVNEGRMCGKAHLSSQHSLPHVHT